MLHLNTQIHRAHLVFPGGEQHFLPPLNFINAPIKSLPSASQCTLCSTWLKPGSLPQSSRCSDLKYCST